MKAQETGDDSVSQFDGGCLGLRRFYNGLGKLDFCHDDFSESSDFKSHLGAKRTEKGVRFRKASAYDEST